VQWINSQPTSNVLQISCLQNSSVPLDGVIFKKSGIFVCLLQLEVKLHDISILFYHKTQQLQNLQDFWPPGLFLKLVQSPYQVIMCSLYNNAIKSVSQQHNINITV